MHQNTLLHTHTQMHDLLNKSYFVKFAEQVKLTLYQPDDKQKRSYKNNIFFLVRKLVNISKEFQQNSLGFETSNKILSFCLLRNLLQKINKNYYKHFLTQKLYHIAICQFLLLLILANTYRFLDITSTNLRIHYK